MILALDTASRRVSIALAAETEILAEHTWRTENNHTRELAPAVQRVLRSAAVQPSALHAIAVAIGPGSFTGLRIGLGFAKGLALAQRLDLVGVPTLDILARAQPEFDGALLAVLQAGRGRIAAARYWWQENTWRTDSPGRITTWQGALAKADAPLYVCGEIDTAGARLLPRNAVRAPAALNVRRAAVLAGIAAARRTAGECDDPATLVPIYLQQTGAPPNPQ